LDGDDGDVIAMPEDVITPRAYRLVILWAAGLVIFYLLVGYFGARQLRGYRDQTAQLRKAWLESVTGKEGAGTNIDNSQETKPGTVRVGIYVNRIGEIDLRESSWTAHFDLWFHWKDKNIDPGETFQISNGDIDAREKREGEVNGAERYERYQVKARMARYFDPTRFPFADQPLVIQVEDGLHGVDALKFVADTKNSAISPTAITYDIVKIGQVMTGVRLRDFGSTRGRPQRASERPNVHSQFVFAMLVNPPGPMFYLKMFHVLFSSVAIAVLALFIKPIHVDPRFGLGVGAVFAAIGNMIAIATFLPRAQQATLSDMVNVLGLATIFLTLVQSAISLYQYDTMGLERLSRLFDKVSFAVILIGYVLINVVLVLAARS
jgi:hypothetical protein